MSNFSKTDHNTKWIPVRDISVVWRQAQRELVEWRAKAIADAFDPDVFGIVTVAHIAGNTYHCIDGQHRVTAVRMVLGEDQLVPCNVISGVSDAKAAAAKFLALNSGKNPGAIDKFKAAVTAGQEPETGINRVITNLGYHVAASSDDGAIRAISTCCSIYKRLGGEVLRDALATIKRTWGKNADAVDANIIAGFAEFLSEHGKSVDRERFAAKVAKAYAPGRLIGAAKAGREMFNGKMAESMARLLLNTHNAGLRTGRIGDQEAA